MRNAQSISIKPVAEGQRPVIGQPRVKPWVNEVNGAKPCEGATIKAATPLVELLYRPGCAASEGSGARVAAMQKTKSALKSRSLTSVERKNIHVGA